LSKCWGEAMVFLRVTVSNEMILLHHRPKAYAGRRNRNLAAFFTCLFPLRGHDDRRCRNAWALAKTSPAPTVVPSRAIPRFDIEHCSDRRRPAGPNASHPSHRSPAAHDARPNGTLAAISSGVAWRRWGSAESVVACRRAPAIRQYSLSLLFGATHTASHKRDAASGDRRPGESSWTSPPGWENSVWESMPSCSGPTTSTLR
jgi:hypothetical protein